MNEQEIHERIYPPQRFASADEALLYEKHAAVQSAQERVETAKKAFYRALETLKYEISVERHTELDLTRTEQYLAEKRSDEGDSA